MPIKLSQLHNFAAVVEAGAVRQAAKALNLSGRNGFLRRLLAR